MDTYIYDNLYISVVIPAHNEAENLPGLIQEIDENLSPWVRGYEIIVIDDHSTDDSIKVLQEIKKRYPNLRVYRHKSRLGQSAGVYSGVEVARYPIVVTLDGDGQNPPSEIPKLVEGLVKDKSLSMVVGWRKKRSDNIVKRISSRVANLVRNLLLKDGIRDSGCGLKAFYKKDFLSLPCINHMHRFLPFMFQMLGKKVKQIEVNHRPRKSGKGHYTTIARAIVGVIDIAGLLYLKHRYIPERKKEEI